MPTSSGIPICNSEKCPGKSDLGNTFKGQICMNPTKCINTSRREEQQICKSALAHLAKRASSTNCDLCMKASENIANKSQFQKEDKDAQLTCCLKREQEIFLAEHPPPKRSCTLL